MGGIRVSAVLCGLGTIAMIGSCAPLATNGVSPPFLQCQLGTDSTATGTMPANAELRLQVPPGHTLVIPAGGAEAGRVFTLRSLPVPMARVVLTPSGPLRPGAPLPEPLRATLTLSYQNCQNAGDPANYRIWRQRRPGDAGPPWSRVGGIPARGQQSISVSLDSLSTYSLAAN
jgi:hypothetical protein